MGPHELHLSLTKLPFEPLEATDLAPIEEYRKEQGSKWDVFCRRGTVFGRFSRYSISYSYVEQKPSSILTELPMLIKNPTTLAHLAEQAIVRHQYLVHAWVLWTPEGASNAERLLIGELHFEAQDKERRFLVHSIETLEAFQQQGVAQHLYLYAFLMRSAEHPEMLAMDFRFLAWIGFDHVASRRTAESVGLRSQGQVASELAYVLAGKYSSTTAKFPAKLIGPTHFPALHPRPDVAELYRQMPMPQDERKRRIAHVEEQDRRSAQWAAKRIAPKQVEELLQIYDKQWWSEHGQRMNALTRSRVPHPS